MISLPARFARSATTLLLASGRLRDVLEIAPDFHRGGDHMVTTTPFRRGPEWNSSTALGAYRDGLADTSYLYWDIELEP